MEDESGDTRCIIDELHSSVIQGDQMEVQSGVTWRIIAEIHSWDIQGDQMEGERMVLLEVSSMDFFLVISN